MTTGEKGRAMPSRDREASLGIEVTTQCNSRCLHCFARAGRPGRETLPPATVEGVLSEGREAGYRHLHVTGGEPLLWPALFETLDAARAMGYRTAYLNTNGTLLTRETAERLAGCEGLRLSVSLEGPEALHDRFRGAGAHRRAVSGIENALREGLDVVVFTLAGKGLLPELPRFADDLFDRFPGIRYLTLIQLINVEGEGFPLSDELLEPEEFLVLVQTASLLNLYGLPTHVKNSTLATAVSNLMGMPWIPGVHPLHREGNLIVRANGLIGLSHSGGGTFGRYEPGAIRRVLSSDAYRRAVHPDETVCPSCGHVDVCRSYGMLRPTDRNMAPFRDEPFCKSVMDAASLRQEPQQTFNVQKQEKEKTHEKSQATQNEEGLCRFHGGCRGRQGPGHGVPPLLGPERSPGVLRQQGVQRHHGRDREDPQAQDEAGVENEPPVH